MQGFGHEANTINDSSFRGKFWVLGQTCTTITLLPDQRIVDTMEDEVVVQGYEAPEPAIETLDGGWKVGDTAKYCGMVNGKHVYAGGAAHQGEMSGESG